MSKRTDTKVNRDKIEKGLLDGSLVLTEFVPKIGKQPHQIWSTFKIICDANDKSKIIDGWMMCTKCKGIGGLYAWNKKGGFGTQTRHINKDYNTANKQQPTISSMFTKKNKLKPHEDRIHRACERFVIRDLRPFNAVEGEGFIELCDTMISIGASIGSKVEKKELREIIPCGNTISRKLIAFETELRSKLQLRLQGTLKECPIPLGITTDVGLIKSEVDNG